MTCDLWPVRVAQPRRRGGPCVSRVAACMHACMHACMWRTSVLPCGGRVRRALPCVKRPPPRARCTAPPSTSLARGSEVGRVRRNTWDKKRQGSFRGIARGFPPQMGSVFPQYLVSSCIALFLTCIVMRYSSILFALVSCVYFMYFAGFEDVCRPRPTIHVFDARFK